MSVHSLQQSAGKDLIMREELLRRFPALAEDDQALLDTLDGVSDFDRQVLAVMRSADSDDMLAAGIDARLDELMARKARLDERVKSKRAAVLDAMERAHRQRVELPDFTVYVSTTAPKVVITDEEALPQKYRREKTSWTPDKKLIKEDLDKGDEVAGATLSNGGRTLNVKRS